MSSNLSVNIPKPFEWLFKGKEELKKKELIRRLFFVYLSVFMSMGALVWGLLCLYFNLTEASYVPFGYMAFTAVNIYFCRKANSHTLSCNLQVLLSISLPFLFQFMLGGIAASGCVMLWSVVAMIGSMSFQDARATLKWFIMLVAMVLLSCYLESTIFAEQEEGFEITLLALNTLCISTIIVGLCRHFMDLQLDLTKQVVKGTHVLVEKNNQISRSIQSAKRLQESILPTEEAFKSAFPKSFVLNRPRDIVSGDFYWIGKYAGKRIVACVDCTGHGVPGAFMSMMGYNFLNEIVYKDKVMEPSEILKRMDHAIRIALKQDLSGASDGMDMSIISYDPSSGELDFAGARSNIVIFDGTSEYSLFKGSKISIGGTQTHLQEEFATQKIKCNTGDILLMSTDGLADQFGGPKGKRMRTKRLYEALAPQSNKGVPHFGRNMENNLVSWMGDLDQVDDILALAIGL